MKNLILILFFAVVTLNAQDSVDVTFRYHAPATPTIFLVGEFNGWNNAAWPMTYSADNLWTRTVRVRIGGNPTPPGNGVPGAWQYKFYYAGVSAWPNDPLNHHENPLDNGNTYIITKDPTIFHLLPNQRQPIVKTGTPIINAYLLPKVGNSIDTSSIVVTVDGISYTGIGKYFDVANNQLSFPLPDVLSNGNHKVLLTVNSSSGLSNSDSVTFTSQAGYIQITSQGGYATRNPMRTIRGIIQNNSVTSAKLIHNSTDTVDVVVTSGAFTGSDTLSDGVNTFKAIADTGGAIVSSEVVSYTYVVDHAPYARAMVSADGGAQLTLSAAGSTHPKGFTISYKWIDDAETPLGLNGTTGVTADITKPVQPGEYYFSLIASDSTGAADTARFYFIIKNDGTFINPTVASNPQWVKQARVYFLFPKAFTAQGTIAAAAQRLQYVKNMGFSVIWMMPVMKNAYPIDQHYGPGYNITDFYNVAPEYGTNQDFKDFISQAHALGIKVILDVTPNHTSRFHPWSQDAHLFKQDSRYWTWYEHSTIAHNTNGLGQSFDPDGFNYYSAFSDQLLNYNWNDIDARTEMINVYKHWIKEFGLDGYRFDVYWGPHRRYGEPSMGTPMREALKHIKPDIFLLAEDDGTGSGTEVIYADHDGGVDAAYDFKLYFSQVRGFGFSGTAVDNFHNEMNNGGYFPGPNSLYMRFMESQDEDRITYFYSNSNALDAVTTFNKTKPMATALFASPGFPMIWNGQEVGWGYGISGAKEDRNRSTIGWEFQGKPILQQHYQRLAWIRGSYPAFATQTFERISTGNALVYGLLRKYQNENIVSLSNFGSANASVSLTLTAAGSSNILIPNPQDGKIYYVSDVYNDSIYQITFTGGTTNFSMNLPGYGSAVLVISDSIRSITVPNLTSIDEIDGAIIPSEYSLSQNFPNPFNPSTTIRYQIPQSGFVSLKVYDMIGREVETLVSNVQQGGTYTVTLDGSRLSSGIYFYSLRAGKFTETKKMMFIK